MIDYQVVKHWSFEEVRHSYGERECMLYALAVGFGSDPESRGELRYTYERDLRAVPTMATVIGAPGAWWRDPRTGADGTKLVHGEQRLRLFKPLPPAGTLLAVNRVQSLTDKGPGKGAIGVVIREIRDAHSGELLAEGTNVSVLRGDGGFSAADGKSDPAPTPLPPMPERPCDSSVDLATLRQAALLYRLTGDMNPLHADPEFAARAGFDRPILHGLCTYGMACHALLRTYLDFEAARLRALAVRFTAPVFPGDVLKFEFWSGAGRGSIRLRARCEARNATVLDQGVAEID
jgi:acyl dehydratase